MVAPTSVKCGKSILMDRAAGLAALQEAGPDVERMVETYDRRRRFLIEHLR